MIIEERIVGDYAVEAHLDEEFAEKRSSLLRVMTRLGIELRGIVVTQKLSGQVLKRRTGNLARSQVDKTTDEGSTITTAVGFNARTTPYGVYHEFGVPHSWIIEAKDAKALRFKPAGAKSFIFRKRVTHPPLPERSFLRSALAGFGGYALAEMATAVGGKPA